MGSKLPPTNAPSIESCIIMSRMLSGFTLPPYRLLEEMGFLPREFPELTAVAKAGREHYYQALIGYLGTHRSMSPFTVPIVYRTLGPSLPRRSPALAFAWVCGHGVARKYPDSVRRAGHTGDAPCALGEAVASGDSGVVFTHQRLCRNVA